MPHDQPLRWRKSSKSGGNGGQCVELAHTLDSIRDSKEPEFVLTVLKPRLLDFLEAIRGGQFDR